MKIFSFLRQLFQGHWLFLAGLTVLQALGGIIPVLGMWATAKLIDAMIEGQGIALAGGVSGKIILLLSFCALIFLLEEIFSIFHGVFADSLKDIVYRRMKYMLMQRVALAPRIHLFEACPSRSNRAYP